MAKLNPVKQIGFLQKGDDVSSRNLCKELLDGANIEVSGSDALVQCTVDKKVLDSDTAITGVTKWRGFSKQVRVGPMMIRITFTK